MSLSALFQNNAGWMTMPDLSAIFLGGPVGRYDQNLVGNVDGEISDGSSQYLADLYMSELSRPLEMSQSPLFKRRPPEMTELQALSTHLNIVWDVTRNPQMRSGLFESARNFEVCPEKQLRTILTYKLLLMSQLSGGKDLSDIKVAVEGHGTYTTSAAIMLMLGATVISRETSMNHGFFEDDYPDMKIKFAPFLKSGQLILSSCEELHPCEYDIVIWEHPTVLAMDRSFRMESHHCADDAVLILAENLKEGGMLLLESDHDSYIDEVKYNGKWDVLLDRKINSASFITPSSYFYLGGHSVIAQRQPSK